MLPLQWVLFVIAASCGILVTSLGLIAAHYLRSGTCNLIDILELSYHSFRVTMRNAEKYSECGPQGTGQAFGTKRNSFSANAIDRPAD